MNNTELSVGSQITVVVADDHEIVRSALSARLESEGSGETSYRLVGEAKNGLEAIACIKAEQPDLVFLDISMPLASGLEIIHDLRRWSPHTKIIAFTGVTASGLLANVTATGVDALFSKATDLERVFEKLPLILRGGRFIDPELVELIEAGAQLPDLTARERQVLNMVVTGKSNKEIARLLNISPKTVDKHRTSFMQKLDVHSLAELMARAVKDGLIDPYF